jgi:hypothetical protein
MYRRTRKYSEKRLAAMRQGKERARMEQSAPYYPPALPDLRIRITVERFDVGEESHIFELRKTRRIDQYAVFVDGEPWRVAGLSTVLAGLRKATPRLMSSRSM